MIRNILVLVVLSFIYLLTKDFLLVYVLGVCYNIVDFITDPEEVETENNTIIIASLFSFMVPMFNLITKE